MDQNTKAARFAELHVKGDPLLLYNAWDVGSANAIIGAGAKAIATSSWSIAEAHGYRDGEDMPIELAERIIARIAATVDAPVSADIEGGYSDDDGQLANNVARLLDCGVIGINFEDRVVKGSGLYDVERQAQRIEAIRAVAEQKHVDLFINARTDVFFTGHAADSLTDAIHRAKAYADAGASGLFVPGLHGDALIATICDASGLPVNVMVSDGVPATDRLAGLGVARVSWGPIPYLNAMAALQAEATAFVS